MVHFLNRHNFLTLHSERIVQRYGKMAFALFYEALQTFSDTHRRNCYTFRRPRTAPCAGHGIERTEYVVQIVHGFAFTHIHDIGQFIGIRYRENLIKDISRGEMPMKTECACHTETASHLAPSLCANAQCSTVVIRDIDGFDIDRFAVRSQTAPLLDRFAVRCAKEIFLRAIF